MGSLQQGPCLAVAAKTAARTVAANTAAKFDAAGTADRTVAADICQKPLLQALPHITTLQALLLRQYVDGKREQLQPQGLTC